MCLHLAKKTVWLLWLIGLGLPMAATAHGIFYELHKPGQPASYLLGTMHVGDPEVLGLLDEIDRPLDSVEQVVLEIVPNAQALFAVNRAMILPPKQSLARLVGADLYARVVALAQRKGLPERVVNRLRPWALAVTLAMPESNGLAMDQVIYQRALDHHKKVLGLETPREQVALFGELSQTLQVRMLEQVVVHADEVERQFQALTRAYLDRDLERLQAIARKETAGDDPQLQRWFEERMIRARNHRMVQRLLPILDQGSTLVAVGALHLPGREGLLNLLRQAGYRVQARF